MRVYISGPITGVPGYRDEFQRAKEILEGQGHDVVNPAELEAVIGHSFSYEEILMFDLTFLKRCDVLVQLPGWERSRGACTEYGYALAGGIDILSLADFEEKEEKE